MQSTRGQVLFPGIGAGMVKELAKRGASVAFTYLSDVTGEEFNRIFHINLLFPLLLVQETPPPPHLQQKARIVNVGGVNNRPSRADSGA